MRRQGPSPECGAIALGSSVQPQAENVGRRRKQLAGGAQLSLGPPVSPFETAQHAAHDAVSAGDVAPVDLHAGDERGCWRCRQLRVLRKKVRPGGRGEREVHPVKGIKPGVVDKPPAIVDRGDALKAVGERALPVLATASGSGSWRAFPSPASTIQVVSFSSTVSARWLPYASGRGVSAAEWTAPRCQETV